MSSTESQDQSRAAIPFFEGEQQQLALKGLSHSYAAPNGLAVIIASRGAGVTTLVREHLRRLRQQSGRSDQPDAAFIDVSQTTVAGLLCDILGAFGYVLPDAKLTELLSMTRVVALHHAQAGLPPLLVFEHADQATPKVLDIIIELAGMRSGPKSACRMVLSGSNRLEQIIKAERMQPVAKRLSFRTSLSPLAEAERRTFIRHVLNARGLDAHSNAFDNLIRLGDGLPGTIADVILRAADLLNAPRPLESGDVLQALEGHDAAEQSQPAAIVDDAPGDPAESTQIRKISYDEARPVPFDDGGATPHSADALFGEILVNCNGRLLQRYPINRRKVLIGRAGHNDIALDSKWVSRHHAIIICHEHGASLVDINSTNGMTVNSRQVRQQALMDKDIIVIGDYRLKYLNSNARRPDHEDDDEHLTDTRMLRTLNADEAVDSGQESAETKKRGRKKR